jgi:hypothetical protein
MIFDFQTPLRHGTPFLITTQPRSVQDQHWSQTVFSLTILTDVCRVWFSESVYVNTPAVVTD